MYTLAEISEMMNALLKGQHDLKKDWHLIIDSRTVVQPDTAIFFALQTGQNDGHKYIGDLIKKGVNTFVVTKDHPIHLAPGINFFIVDDTLEALQSLVTMHRKHFEMPVIGITGSNGKTIVKEWLIQLLSKAYKICASPKSYNSQIGVPLSVWHLNEYHTLGIFEAGISKAEEMQNLERIIQPEIGVLTHMGSAHDEGFENTEHKLNEKLKLFKHCKVVLSQYNPQIQVNSGQQFLSFDFQNPKADLNIVSVLKHTSSSLLTGVYKQQTYEISVPFLDDAAIENACLCWLIALHLGAFEAADFSKLRAVSMRLELKQAINGSILINDSYSNDLNALSAAFSFLKQQSIHQKTTVILSDIEQSGLTDIEWCGHVDALLIDNKVDHFIGIGPVLLEHKFTFTNSSAFQFYENTEKFLADFNPNQFHNETILLKGARSFQFEKVALKLERQNHGTVLEINLTAALQNLNFIKSSLPTGTKIMGMVKAFAYGSGSYEIAKMLDTKVDYLAVAYTDEGVTLRQNGVQVPIMVMNTEPDSLSQLITQHLEPVVFGIEQLKTILQFLNGHSLKIHLEIDTGMHRLGFSPSEIADLCELLVNNQYLQVQSVFSHLSGSDEATFDEFTKYQFQLFNTIYQSISDAIGYKPIRHISNTAAILRFDQKDFDMVRLGIGLYGIDPSGTQQNKLETVFTLKTSISQIKTIAANESVGYARKAIENRARKIAVLAIGYADGLNRLLSNGKGSFLINGKKAPIVGNVCMDMCMVDVSEVPCNEGDEAILFGREQSILDIAKELQTIPYEVLTAISQRVKRVYVSE